MAKLEHQYGVGERSDGTIDTFPMSEWPARLAELRAMLDGETKPDDLEDLGAIEKLFEAEPKDAAADERRTVRVFKLKPPGGEAFVAALAGGRIVSNRAGKWADEDQISVADLAMPEQRLGEWDVEEIPADDPRVAALRRQ
jgi:hypothetical protein